MIFLKINLLLAFGFLISLILKRLAFSHPRVLMPSQLLKLTHWSYLLAVALPIASLALHLGTVFQPTVQIWSAASFRMIKPAKNLPPPQMLGLSLPSGHILSVTTPQKIEILLLVLFFLGAGWTCFRLVKGIRWLMAVVQSSHLVKKIGGVRILLHESVGVPFSFWLPFWPLQLFGGLAFVVIPQELVTENSRFRLAILHELQHHKQGDTRWVYWTQLMRLFFFWNPFTYLWEKQVSQIQEFACDEKLIVRKRVSPHAYGRCLVLTAQNCLNSHPAPVGTIGMAVGSSGITLKRRINMMFDYRKHKQSKWSGVLAGTAVVLSLTTVAVASQGLIKDRRLSMADAQKLALAASQGSTFPIVVNEPVLKELNRYVGTPDGRDFIRDSLARMETYHSMISAKIQHYGLPEELMAIPITESGYRNIRGKFSAGLWMFIESTAHKFGMEVDANEDERMNVDVETDAAMRLLGSDYLRFQDWLLAIEAYNAGETRVQEGIDATGSRDAWKVVHAGYDNDPNYLARVMAAVIILKNPSAINQSN